MKKINNGQAVKKRGAGFLALAGVDLRTSEQVQYFLSIKEISMKQFLFAALASAQTLEFQFIDGARIPAGQLRSALNIPRATGGYYE